MLAIRLQRTGRSGHAQFRVIVQDSRFSPKRGRVVSYLGSYDPHTKGATLDGEKASKYLQNGAQPSDRVAKLFKKEGIKLPAWVKLDEPKKRTIRNPEKRRSTAPAKSVEQAPSEPEPVAEAAPEAEPSVEAETPEPAAETTEEAQPASEETTATPEESTPEAEESAVEPEKASDEKSEEKPPKS